VKFKEIAAIHMMNLVSQNEKLRNHAKTLCGRRVHGSTTEVGLFDVGVVDPEFDWELEDNEDGVVSSGCEAYTALVPMASNIGAVALSRLSTDELARVVERDGFHGKELFLPVKSSGGLVHTIHEWQAMVDKNATVSIITVIIGEFEGERAIFTWHPGLPLVPGVDRLNPNTAVKLV